MECHEQSPGIGGKVNVVLAAGHIGNGGDTNRAGRRALNIGAHRFPVADYTANRIPIDIPVGYVGAVSKIEPRWLGAAQGEIESAHRIWGGHENWNAEPAWTKI